MASEVSIGSSNYDLHSIQDENLLRKMVRPVKTQINRVILHGRTQ